MTSVANGNVIDEIKVKAVICMLAYHAHSRRPVSRLLHYARSNNQQLRRNPVSLEWGYFCETR